MKRHLEARFAGLLLLAVVSTPALADSAADSVANFYRGKTVTLLIGAAPGGEYDTQARLVGRHIGTHIPGSPTVVVQNMDGAGGLVMANHLYVIAAKDGTIIGALPNQLPALQAVGGRGIQFDAAKFQWMGAIAPTHETMGVMTNSGVRTIADALDQQVLVGAVGRGSMTYLLPSMINAVLGTRFKVVSGYSGGNDILLAMARGEVQGRENTWSSWKLTRPDWLRDKKIVILVQAGPKAPDLPGVPSIEDLAKNDQDKTLIDLVMSSTQLGRPLAVPPGVPSDRVEALRSAFLQTMRDPAFLAEAAAEHIDVDPVAGERMQSIVEKLAATPKEVAARAKEFLE